MATTATARDGFVSDQRGAVMITGLFLSFFLVGALWFVLGIGDALVFRQRMQEAADHAAFTSAALHAKGMNFIAAVNLVMIVLVVVHLVLGLIHDITLVVCAVTAVGCGAWVPARNLYTGYAKLMKPVLTGLHRLEMAAAYGYPYLGLVKSVQVGDKYGKQHRVGDVDVFAVSPSMVPDFVSQTSRVGLPVSAKPMNELCRKIADWTFDTVLVDQGYDPDKARTFLDKVADKLRAGVNVVTFGRLGNKSDTDKILEKLAKLMQGAVVNRYCNALTTKDATKGFREMVSDGNEGVRKQNEREEKEFRASQGQGPILPHRGVDLSSLPLEKLDPGFDGFWGAPGPLAIDGSAKNGHFFMQVWAINFRPRLEDASERKVKIASRDTTGGTPEEGPLGYFAQAEFYFDCADKWSSESCNGEGVDNHAMYRIQWRARLRKVGVPDFGKLVGGYLYGIVTSSDSYQALRKIITEDNALYRRLSNGPFSTAAVDELKKKVDEQVAKGEAEAKSRVVDALDGAHDHVLDGVYH